MADTPRTDAIADDEARRLAALDALGLSDRPPSPGVARIVETAREVFGVPAAYVSLVGETHEFRKVAAGVPTGELPRCEAFCDHTVRSDAVLVVEDTHADERFLDLPSVREGVRFYAGAPLILSGGERIGALAVLDHAPRAFDETDRMLLSELAHTVVAEIEHLRAVEIAAGDPEPGTVPAEDRFRALAAANACIVWRADPTGALREVALSGPFSQRAPTDFLGFAWIDLVAPEDRRTVLRAALRTRRDRVPYEGVHRLLDNAGRPRWARIRAVPLVDEDGNVAEWVGKCADVHGLMLEQDERRRAAERIALALRAGRMVTWEFDAEARRIVHSDNTRDVLGIPDGDLEAMRARIHPDDLAVFDGAYAPGGPMRDEALRYNHPDGRLIWLSSRGIEMRDPEGRRRIVGVTFDITERKEAEARAWQAANRDALTGVANRAAFQRSLDEALATADRTGGSVAMLLVDIDEFKDINDSVGHDAGDMLLREAAARLGRVAGPDATVARLGGDEFAVVLEAVDGLDDGLALADRVVAAFREPVGYAGRPLAGRASVGVALYPDHAEDACELMKSADLALYCAKEQGRNRAAGYRPSLRASMEARIAVLDEIRQALRGDGIVPYYQPKVDLRTGAVTGFEALARWRHPMRGLLTPGAFADAFENPEIALAIGERMVACVADDLASWLADGLEPGTVAVNLSAAEFGRADLPEAIFATLDAVGVPRWRLGIEVTETVFLGKRASAVAAVLARFAKAGMRIALDDFGTGYASLTHLKQFPVDDIKIDRSFVRDLERDPGDAAIVGAVIGLGRALGLRVVAEGVEERGQEDMLRAMGCDEEQGFLVAKPMPASRVPWFLREGHLRSGAVRDDRADEAIRATG